HGVAHARGQMEGAFRDRARPGGVAPIEGKCLFAEPENPLARARPRLSPQRAQASLIPGENLREGRFGGCCWGRRRRAIAHVTTLHARSRRPLPNEDEGRGMARAEAGSGTLRSRAAELPACLFPTSRARSGDRGGPSDRWG